MQQPDVFLHRRPEHGAEQRVRPVFARRNLGADVDVLEIALLDLDRIRDVSYHAPFEQQHAFFFRITEFAAKSRRWPNPSRGAGVISRSQIVASAPRGNSMWPCAG